MLGIRTGFITTYLGLAEKLRISYEDFNAKQIIEILLHKNI